MVATGLRRHVTVMFSDLCGSTALGDTTDPEVLAELLQQLKAAALQVVRHHDGVVNQFYGDGVMAIFGFPTPQEDGARRAAEAALELHRLVRDLPVASLLPSSFDMRLHTGIHSGLVLVREGDSLLGRYELVGDPINTAAGLCASAGVDEIVVSSPTMSAARRFFDAEEIQPVLLKGKPDPMPAFRLLGPSKVTTHFEALTRRGLAPFVGRELELERLDLRLREARQGRLKVVRIVGEPGIGKTRAADEFLRGAEASDCAVHRGYCESYGSVAPLQPLLLMLEQIFRLGQGLATRSAVERIETRLAELGLERHAAEILRILAVRSGRPDEGESAGSQREEITALALGDLMVALASERPLILFIDDWQWVDDASRQVVGSLIRLTRNAPLLILTTSRQVDPSDVAADDVEILEMVPFDPAESTQTIDALLPEGLDLGIASTIHERSGGNPLFLEELCQALSETSDAAARSAGATPTLHALIEARVHRLPDAQAELVREAAVIGNVIPAWLLEQLSGYREGDEILRELASNDLIYAGEAEGMLRFKHGITREVVYQSVGLAQRRALHLRIAEALETHGTPEGREEPYEALAYHYSGGADHIQASRYAELAGNKAMASSSLDRARQQYGAALASLDHLEPTEDVRRRWLEICRRLAFACVFSPAPEQLETFERAAEYARELGDLDALGHARFWLGFINYCLGEQKASIEQYQQGLQVAEEAGNAKLVAQLRANLGECLASACEYPEALALLDESIEAKRRLRSGQHAGVPTGSAYAVACKACVQAELGDFAHAHRLMDLALSAMRGSGSPVEGSIRSFHAIILLWQGRWKECIEAAELVQAMGERVNGPYLFCRGRSEAAYARFMLTGESDALAVLRHTTDWLEARRMRLYISINHGYLADAAARLGETALARLCGERALERAVRRDRVGEGMACRALARVAARGLAAEMASPESYLAMALESAQARRSEREVALTRLAQAELSADRGQPREAGALLAQARHAFQRMGMQWHDLEAQRLADTL